MADPRELEQIPRLGVDDPLSVVDALRRQAAATAAAQGELSDLRGGAESEDGTVRAVVGPAGLEDLQLEPKAMRMPSQDLAAPLPLNAFDAVGIVVATSSSKRVASALRSSG